MIFADATENPSIVRQMEEGYKPYLEAGIALADHEYENTRENGLTDLARFWVDDMYMVGSHQVQAYKATGKQIYLDRAALFIKIYCDELQRDNGMFHQLIDDLESYAESSCTGMFL